MRAGGAAGIALAGGAGVIAGAPSVASGSAASGAGAAFTAAAGALFCWQPLRTKPESAQARTRWDARSSSVRETGIWRPFGLSGDWIRGGANSHHAIDSAGERVARRSVQIWTRHGSLVLGGAGEHPCPIPLVACRHPSG